jgi:hypothetical protein
MKLHSFPAPVVTYVTSPLKTLYGTMLFTTVHNYNRLTTVHYGMHFANF